LLSDYTTSDNIHLYKGQHVQIVQRLNNEFSIIQLLNTNNNSSSSSNTSNTITATTAGSESTTSPTSPSTATIVQPKHLIEVQVPNSIIKCRIKSVFDGNLSCTIVLIRIVRCIISNFYNLVKADLQSTSTTQNSNGDNDSELSKLNSAGALSGSAAAVAAAAKRKGSFKKWLRSSHRKLTSNSSSSSTATQRPALKDIDSGNNVNSLLSNAKNGVGANQKYLHLSSNVDIENMSKIKVRNVSIATALFFFYIKVLIFRRYLVIAKI
jgi:hypothetical protein